MKLLIIILAFLTSLSYGQENNTDIQVLAKLITPGHGSKIYIARYKVIKVLKGTLSNDTINVGYYFYNDFQNTQDTSLLNLTIYNGITKIFDYYIFPDYDAKKGIEKVSISIVDFDYWEGCETGRTKCEPLTFIRGSKGVKWFLIMPCGGTSTTVTLSQQRGIPKENEIIQKCEIYHTDCPPTFDLTNLKDGKYYAYMLACGLGGQIEINLKTMK